MKNFKRTVLVFFVFLVATACSQQPSPKGKGPEIEPDKRVPPFERARSYEEEGFTLFFPETWELLTEEKVQGSITLRLQETGSASAQLIVSYFPDDGSTRREILQKAEGLLEVSLFRINEKPDSREERIGDRVIPMIHARSGQTEIKAVQTAVMMGEQGYLFATLIAREEAKDNFIPIFHSIIEGIDVK